MNVAIPCPGISITKIEQGKSSGSFTHCLKTGQWKIFDEKGKVTVTDTFDNNGQVIPLKQP